MGWATFCAIFLQTHLVTLVLNTKSIQDPTPEIMSPKLKFSGLKLLPLKFFQSSQTITIMHRKPCYGIIFKLRVASFFLTKYTKRGEIYLPS
jgi:hypothetical protein